MPDTTPTRYAIDHFYPGYDRQTLWDLFVDNEGWTESEILPGEISIVEPGQGHPQGQGAVRSPAEELAAAFDRYAPHFEGDKKYDSKWLAQQQFG